MYHHLKSTKCYCILFKTYLTMRKKENSNNLTTNNSLTTKNWSHHGVEDKPLALYPGVPNSIPGFFSLSDET